jgi:hypothetical protein
MGLGRKEIVKAQVIYRDVIDHHQLAGIEIIGEPVQMVTDSNAVTYFVGNRLPFPTEFKTVTGVIAGN